MISDYCCNELISKLVNSSFEVNNGKSLTTLRLSEVSEVKDNGKYESHSLFFTGPKNQFLPQSTYTFRHETLNDDTPLFIVPIEESESAFKYQACLSYLKTK